MIVNTLQKVLVNSIIYKNNISRNMWVHRTVLWVVNPESVVRSYNPREILVYFQVV